MTKTVMMMHTEVIALVPLLGGGVSCVVVAVVVV